MKAVVCVLALSPLAALAGGSNYGVTPGALRPENRADARGSTAFK